MGVDSASENRILAGLPERERSLLLSALEEIELYLGDVLDNAGDSLRFLHFPLHAGLSVVNQQAQPHDRQVVDVSVVGREGCTGASIVQGSDKSPSTVMVEIGGTAVRLKSSEVLQQRADLPYLWNALARYNFLLYRHAIISVGCSQFHSPEQRAARWLKAHWHRTGVALFPFSTPFFAAQAGLDEQTTAEVLSELERRGVIQLSHNTIAIANQDALAARSCDCFAQAKAATDEYAYDLAHIASAYK
ncbi:MAG TPA: helix-turn-helix domain-containing protein [Nitrospira sp.]|nr:helix-turn-helix domain-containing protein [Nitrospira sp.]